MTFTATAAAFPDFANGPAIIVHADDLPRVLACLRQSDRTLREFHFHLAPAPDILDVPVDDPLNFFRSIPLAGVQSADPARPLTKTDLALSRAVPSLLVNQDADAGAIQPAQLPKAIGRLLERRVRSPSPEPEFEELPDPQGFRRKFSYAAAAALIASTALAWALSATMHPTQQPAERHHAPHEPLP